MMIMDGLISLMFSPNDDDEREMMAWLKPRCHRELPFGDGGTEFLVECNVYAEFVRHFDVCDGKGEPIHLR